MFSFFLFCFLLETDYATMCKYSYRFPRGDQVGDVLGVIVFVQSVLESRLLSEMMLVGCTHRSFRNRVGSHNVSTDRSERWTVIRLGKGRYEDEQRS